jgi:hypothetical protein
MFLLSTASRPALEPTQSPIKWVAVVLALGEVKRPEDEADYSPLSSADSGNTQIYTPSL